MWAVPYVKGYKVYKDDMVPTHSVVEVTLSSENKQAENTYIKTLPSLKKMFDQEMTKQVVGMAPKEQAEHIRKAKLKLKMAMDEKLLRMEEQFQKHKIAKDHDEYWKLWSTAIEEAWLQFLGHKGNIEKALTGRGKTTFLKRKPQQRRETKKEDDFKHMRNEASKLANQCLKQARRCEQFTMRLEMRSLGNRNPTHTRLNEDAIKAITKATKEDEDWQVDLANVLNKTGREQAENTLMIPVLKRATARFQQQFEKHKAKASKDAAEQKDALYRIKGKGQWCLANNIGGKTLPPLSAVRRKKK